MAATTKIARRLRNDSTKSERKLWSQLRNRNLDGLKFKRQVVIQGYVADFSCWDARLIIELDGGQHAETVEEDAKRTEILEAAGFVVVRYWNTDVLLNMQGVLESILDHVVSARRNPSPRPSPQGRGGDGADTQSILLEGK